LNGQIIMLYSRDEDEPDCISDVQLILKGLWNMGAGKQEDFIYKRIGPTKNDDLLTKLFCENSDERI